jgi:uncharacterized protein YndB with AHSA1/START domain
MATTLRKELTYDAGPEAVHAMLTDPAFREESLERQHVLRGSAKAEGEHVTIEQVQSAASLPSFARKLVGDEIVILQQEWWTSATAADVHVTIPGKPGEMSGTIRLSPEGDGTLEVVEMTIRVGIPLVAGKIEKLVADMLGKALDKEHEAGQDWLAR